MSDDFVRPIGHVSIGKYNHAEDRGRGIRLYCVAFARVHGDQARYALQIFAPETLARGGDGRHFMIATAQLSPQDLVAIGAQIGAAIAEVAAVDPRLTAPGRAGRAAGSARSRHPRRGKRDPR